MLGQNLGEPPHLVEGVASGVGAARMTFGSRKSHFTPAASSFRNSSFGCSWTRIDN